MTTLSRKVESGPSRTAMDVMKVLTPVLTIATLITADCNTPPGQVLSFNSQDMGQLTPEIQQKIVLYQAAFIGNQFIKDQGIMLKNNSIVTAKDKSNQNYVEFGLVSSLNKDGQPVYFAQFRDIDKEKNPIIRTAPIITQLTNGENNSVDASIAVPWVNNNGQSQLSPLIQEVVTNVDFDANGVPNFNRAIVTKRIFTNPVNGQRVTIEGDGKGTINPFIDQQIREILNLGAISVGAAPGATSTLPPSIPTLTETLIAATPTPEATAIPATSYSIEELNAMTAEQVMALAPEAPEGAIRSLYREAPGMVFYQDPKTLDIFGAYDLSKAIAYDSPETIPLAPIRVTTDRDIFLLSEKENMGAGYRDPNFTLEQAMKNFANIKDTVLAGEEPFYRLRVLQAYRDGLIPNIPDSVPPPTLKLYDWKSASITRGFEINSQDSNWFDLEKRSYRDVTIVSDGAGGIRMVQVWKQKDGSVGTLWDHLTQKTIQADDSGLYRRSMALERILRTMFTSSTLKTDPIIDFKDLQGCLGTLQDEAFCTGFMNEEVKAARAQAIDEWMATLMVPAMMQNGQIQFPMIYGTQN